MTTRYGKPRSINVVSLFLLLVVVAGGYLGWKFIPVYWKGYKVDAVLNEAKNDVADLPGLNADARGAEEQKIRTRVYDRVRELGVHDTERQPLEIGFGPDYSYIYARYDVVVRHPFGKTTTMKFNRKVKVPRSRL